MRRAFRNSPHGRKIVLLTAATALTLGVLLGAPHSAQACQDWTDYFTYFSDATKTTQVGWCEFDCYCQTYCDGERTHYYNHQSWSGCL